MGHLSTKNTPISVRMSLTAEEIAEKPQNIEGLEGLDPSGDWELDYEDLEFGTELARGNFGAVSVANYLGTQVAVKRLFDLDEEMKIYLQRELNVLKQIRHPNIVQFMGLSKTDEGLYLITEFVPRGDLCRLLYQKSVKELNSWKLRLQISVQSAQGLAYVHAKKLIHRDIKAANYLVGDNWHIKLCDFGFSRSIQQKGSYQSTPGNQMTLCGTDEWMAPETMMGLDYNQTADVFSFAIYLTEMICRAEPEQRSPSQGFRFDIARFKKQLTKIAPARGCPTSLIAVVLDGTTYEPARRPTIKNILKRLQETAKDYKEAEEVPSGEPPAVSDKGKSSTSTHKRDVISPRPTEAKPTAALVDSTQRKKGKDRDRDRDRDREKHRHKSKNGDDKEKKSDRKEKKKERKRTSAD